MGVKVAAPNTTYWGYFAVSDGTQLVAADTTPVGMVSKNGADDGTVTVSVSAVTTGWYYYTFTVPNTYTAGDRCGLRISYTVNTLYGLYVDAFQVTSGSDLPTVSSGKVALTTAEHTAIQQTDIPAALNAAQPGSPTANSPYAHLASADAQATAAAASAATAATQATTGAASAATAATQATAAATRVTTALPNVAPGASGGVIVEGGTTAGNASSAATQATGANTHAAAVDSRLPSVPAAQSDVQTTVVVPR